MTGLARTLLAVALTSPLASQTKAPREVWREVVTDAEGRVLEIRGAGNVYGADSGIPLIEQARQAAYEFSEGLPDFICDQRTLRLTSTTRPPRWKLRDRVTAEVAYVKGRESYRNIRVNNKPARGSPQNSGSWSSGEFASIQLDLLAHSTNATFRHERSGHFGGRPVEIYAYEVAEKNSHWRVDFDGYRIYPAYDGTVWVDPKSFRLLRIEMRARQVPADYPMDVLEMTVDYGPVRIAGESYLLPVRAENLACLRASLRCSRNEIEFVNHRKFTVESVVTTTDSRITFDRSKKR